MSFPPQDLWWGGNIHDFQKKCQTSPVLNVYSLFDIVGWQNETNESVEGMF